jgi:hypothetical protein
MPLNLFMTGSFAFLFHLRQDGGDGCHLQGEWMKRCLFLLLMTVAFMLPDAASLRAWPAAGGDEVAGRAPLAAPVAEEDRGGRERGGDRNSLGEKKRRKGIGAEFWGGPYWGYGPRWGHPCNTCRAECESDQGSARCQRCRVRCGW